MKIKEPKILKNVLSESDFLQFSNYLKTKEKLEAQYDKWFGRFCFVDPIIDEVSNKITPIAREVFESSTLMPSYSLFAHYEGNSKLTRHKDDNACTYTLDMCVYQTDSWGLGVNFEGQDKIYTLSPNEALAYYGNDQEHWRPEFPRPQEQIVAMVFFHFVEPDHWWFKYGPSYREVAANRLSEEEWKKRNNFQSP